MHVVEDSLVSSRQGASLQMFWVQDPTVPLDGPSPNTLINDMHLQNIIKKNLFG